MAARKTMKASVHLGIPTGLLLIAVRVSLGMGRKYSITPGITTPTMFMKEYGLKGVLCCNMDELDEDLPMLEPGMERTKAKFTIEKEKSKWREWV